MAESDSKTVPGHPQNPRVRDEPKNTSDSAILLKHQFFLNIMPSLSLGDHPFNNKKAFFITIFALKCHQLLHFNQFTEATNIIFLALFFKRIIILNFYNYINQF